MQTDSELSDEIRRFEQQYAENPDSLVFARLADLHRKADRPERALEILGHGLERHPDYLSAHIVRARCLRTLDRRWEAEDVFRRVLELDGENLVALRSLAEMAWARGDGATARDHLTELLQLDPRNEEARDLLEEIRGGPVDAPGREKPAAADGEASAPRDEALGRADDEDLIIEPTSSRESFGAGEPAERGTSGGALDVEPVESGAQPGEAQPGDSGPGEAQPGDPGPDEAQPGDPGPDEAVRDDAADRWWDFLRPGGEAHGESGGPAPAEEGGGPAVGPESEAEELRSQIEELRMEAEQETDLSDTDEDLATETLADLYQAQGFYREAVEMYEELASQRPRDEKLGRRLERARDALGETEGESSPVNEEVPPGAAFGSEMGEPAASTEDTVMPASGESPGTAADELRAVLRGDASPEGRDAPGS